MLFGTWQLNTATGYDSSDYCTHQDIYCYDRYDFKEGILNINYDTLYSDYEIHINEKCEYEFQMTLDEYGNITWSEFYYDTNGQLLENMYQEGKWERDEVGAGHYRYFFDFHSLCGFSKIFTDHFHQDVFSMMLYEDQIDEKRLTFIVPQRDELPQPILREATYIFNKQ